MTERPKFYFRGSGKNHKSENLQRGVTEWKDQRAKVKNDFNVMDRLVAETKNRPLSEMDAKICQAFVNFGNGAEVPDVPTATVIGESLYKLIRKDIRVPCGLSVTPPEPWRPTEAKRPVESKLSADGAGGAGGAGAAGDSKTDASDVVEASPEASPEVKTPSARTLEAQTTAAENAVRVGVAELLSLSQKSIHAISGKIVSDDIVEFRAIAMMLKARKTSKRDEAMALWAVMKYFSSTVRTYRGISRVTPSQLETFSGTLVSDLDYSADRLRQRLKFNLDSIVEEYPGLIAEGISTRAVPSGSVSPRRSQREVLEWFKSSALKAGGILVNRAVIGSGKTTGIVILAQHIQRIRKNDRPGNPMRRKQLLFTCTNPAVLSQVSQWLFNTSSKIPFCGAAAASGSDNTVVYTQISGHHQEDCAVILCEPTAAYRILSEEAAAIDGIIRKHMAGDDRTLTDDTKLLSAKIHKACRYVLVIDEPTVGADDKTSEMHRDLTRVFTVLPKWTVLMSATCPQINDLPGLVAAYRSRYSSAVDTQEIRSDATFIGCDVRVLDSGKRVAPHYACRTRAHVCNLIGNIDVMPFISRMYTIPAVMELAKAIGESISFKSVKDVTPDALGEIAKDLLRKIAEMKDSDIERVCMRDFLSLEGARSIAAMSPMPSQPQSSPKAAERKLSASPQSVPPSMSPRYRLAAYKEQGLVVSEFDIESDNDAEGDEGDIPDLVDGGDAVCGDIDEDRVSYIASLIEDDRFTTDADYGIYGFSKSEVDYVRGLIAAENAPTDAKTSAEAVPSPPTGTFVPVVESKEEADDGDESDESDEGDEGDADDKPAPTASFSLERKIARGGINYRTLATTSAAEFSRQTMVVAEDPYAMLELFRQPGLDKLPSISEMHRVYEAEVAARSKRIDKQSRGNKTDEERKDIKMGIVDGETGISVKFPPGLQINTPAHRKEYSASTGDLRNPLPVEALIGRLDSVGAEDFVKHMFLTGVGIISRTATEMYSQDYLDLVMQYASEGRLAYIIVDKSVVYGTNYPINAVILTDEVSEDPSRFSVQTAIQIAGRTGRVNRTDPSTGARAYFPGAVVSRMLERFITADSSLDTETVNINDTFAEVMAEQVGIEKKREVEREKDAFYRKRADEIRARDEMKHDERVAPMEVSTTVSVAASNTGSAGAAGEARPAQIPIASAESEAAATAAARRQAAMERMRALQGGKKST